ncbi:TonB-dependent siderophore receptor [Campylobacter rectus RM3267]|uniref:TonB-dependent receptor n=2 Tax=Campylobacter rectus TaxID=203 RepID=A0A6G5QLM2_CAMRE|nr:TonB-dependent receptor [Campylobacter rectus]EEF14452.1 TonB-dependent siderophore receptor [Campylobacter rectus RM3267]QCD46376.1 TonB-dependent receptor [Campylobacter rectus]UEB47080.1 TonB-dependent receptor [Campylobacter rectus]
MKFKILVSACAVFAIFAAQANAKESVNTAPVKLEAVEVNSVGDNISNSGIDEGFLSKNVQNGILAGKRALDVPYQINTITKETMGNQGVNGFEDVIKYFPSASITMFGGSVAGRPQTRGFGANVVGNVFWDGFYAVATTATPMAMFESLQVQNGLAGSLYGAQNPVGIFSYTKKRPVDNEHTIWGDYVSRKNFGLGLDSSMKFEKFGYRTVFYGSDGARHRYGNLQRRLASGVFEFYPTDALTIETAASYYEHRSHGFAGLFYIPVTGGAMKYKIPKARRDDVAGMGQPFGGMNLKKTMLSAKLRYAPTDRWYFEGGFAWQRVDRDTHRIINDIYSNNGDFNVYHVGGIPNYRYELPSGYLKAVTDVETFGLKHDLSLQANGYSWNTFRFANSPVSGYANSGGNSMSDPHVFARPNTRNGSNLFKVTQTQMKNLTALDDITINENFSILLSLSNAWIKTRSRAGNNRANPLETRYDESGLSYGASFIYRPIEDVSLYFTYADSLQKGDQGVNADGTIVVLKPYRSKQYEIGAKARISELDLSAALFRIQRPIAYVSNGTFAEQGEQINQGLELMAGGKLVQNLSVFGGVTFIDSKLKNPKLAGADNKNVTGVSKIKSNLLFDYLVPGTDKLAFSANFHYNSGFYTDDLNTQKTSAFFTTDLGARYTSRTMLGKQTTLRFNVNNVFNKKYWAGISPASMDGAATGSTRVAGTTGLSLGESRTFILSAEVKF